MRKFLESLDDVLKLPSTYCPLNYPLNVVVRYYGYSLEKKAYKS